MKKHLIAFLGHVLLTILHYYLIKHKGYSDFQFISFVIVHAIWHDLMITRIYGLKQWWRQSQCCVGSTIFIYLLEMTFKIKSEDKAAFLNRMEKQGETISSSQIKDNKLESYFEVEINSPKQLETAKAILKKSPKINTLTEMEKKKLTKDALKEMVRQELQSALLEKKKMKAEKEMANEAMIPGVDDNLVAGLATLLGVGTPLVYQLIKGLKGKSKEEKAAFIKKASGGIEKTMGASEDPSKNF